MDRTLPDDHPWSARRRANRSGAAMSRHSGRFLTPQECGVPAPRQPRGVDEIFAEGPWHTIRVMLERQGWTTHQIELLHDQLRRGWPLESAKEQVAALTGHCPLRSHQPG